MRWAAAKPRAVSNQTRNNVGALLAEILAKFAAAFLKEYLARHDLKEKVRLELENDAVNAYAKSLEFRVAAGDRDAAVKLRSLGGVITFPSDPPAGPAGGSG